MNIKKFYLYQFFQELMPIYPIYLLLFESKQLSVSQISLLLAIWSLPVVILEVPSGILSDNWSRKHMIAIGSVLKAGCFFLWMFAEGFLLFTIGFILWGISIALCSGSEEAWLFDFLKSNSMEERFAEILGKGRFLSGASSVISAITGGFIGKCFGVHYALILSVLFCLISAGFALSFKEINLYRLAPENQSDTEEPQEKETLKSALKFFAVNRDVLIVALLAILVLGTAGVLDEYDQLIAKGYGLSMEWVGIWVGIRFLTAAFGSYIANPLKSIIQKVFKKKESPFVISLICLLGACFLGIAGWVQKPAIMVLYALYYLLMASGNVLQEDYIQQQIEAQGRATVHSIISLTYNFYGIFCFGVLGLVLSITDLFGSLVVVAVYMVGCVVMLGMFKRNKLS